MIIEAIRLVERSKKIDDIRRDRHKREIVMACFRCKQKWLDDAKGSEAEIRKLYAEQPVLLKCPACDRVAVSRSGLVEVCRG